MAPPDASHPAPAWSFTRDQTLKACPRRYYFQYYLASAGASSAAPALARRVFALNRLTSLDQILGIAVHDCVRLLCKAIDWTEEAIARQERPCSACAEGIE